MSKAPAILILGAGTAGASAAIHLRNQLPDSIIHVIERREDFPVVVGESLPPGVEALLKQLDLDMTLWKKYHKPAFGSRSVWGGPEPYEHEFIFQAKGHGWRLDRQQFNRSLLEKAQSRGIQLWRPYRLQHLEQTQNGWQVEIKSDKKPVQQLEVDFVVDASGRPAHIARALKVEKICFDHLVAVSARYQAKPCASDSYSLVEAAEWGWWYSALLPNQEWLLSFMTDVEYIRRLDLHDTAAWKELLKKSPFTAERVENACQINAPFVKPAESARLDQFSGPRWLAIGDAAGTFDPLSSQGMVKAMRSASIASYAIKDFFAGKADAMKQFALFHKNEYTAYLKTRNQYYALENRWPDSPFWQNRKSKALNL